MVVWRNGGDDGRCGCGRGRGALPANIRPFPIQPFEWVDGQSLRVMGSTAGLCWFGNGSNIANVKLSYAISSNHNF